MDTLPLDSLSTFVVAYALPLLWKILGAIVLWIVGSLVTRAVLGAVNRGLLSKGLDATLAAYTGSMLGVLFKLFLILAILGVFGVETTSFAAVLAAAGVAIGMAWAGLLANFAAGVFLMVLRPFRTGDMITAAGLTGVVKEIGLFATTIETADNLVTYAGDNKIFSDNIVNYSQNPVRRVDRTAQLAHGLDTADAKRRILAKLVAIPHVAKIPAPSVEVLDFNSSGTVLAVRPSCHNNHYWDVYFATNEAIAAACTEGGYPVPEKRQAMRQI